MATVLNANQVRVMLGELRTRYERCEGLQFPVQLRSNVKTPEEKKTLEV